MAAAKKTKVAFNVHVTFGFRHDTPGYEATRDSENRVIGQVQAFDIGDEFEVPENEADEFAKLVDLGLAEYVD